MAGIADRNDTGSLSQIASVLKSNGTDGELVLGFRGSDPEDIDLKEPLFIIFDGLPVPFFIESLVRRGSSKALVHITDIRSFEDAEELVGKPVYVREIQEAEKSIEEDGFEALEGWTLLKVTKFTKRGEIEEVAQVGVISEYVDIPGNPCIEVDVDGESVMIPLHEDLILSVDPEYQEIIMDIPDGLL